MKNNFILLMCFIFCLLLFYSQVQAAVLVSPEGKSEESVDNGEQPNQVSEEMPTEGLSQEDYEENARINSEIDGLKQLYAEAIGSGDMENANKLKQQIEGLRSRLIQPQNLTGTEEENAEEADSIQEPVPEIAPASNQGID